MDNDEFGIDVIIVDVIGKSVFDCVYGRVVYLLKGVLVDFI